MASGRDEIEAEINAHVGSWLDTVPETWGDDFKIGTFALIFEVEFPPDEDSVAGATNVGVGWTCSDHRNWVQAGLFRRALIESEAHIGQPAPDDE